MAIAFLWQLMLVYGLYNGNWTSLFHHGREQRVPPLSVFQDRYIFKTAYDGQEYRIVAHDPFLQRGFEKYLDVPAARYGRILIPALAYFGGLGSDTAIDAAFIAIILIFAGLATYWGARLANFYGYHSSWGMLALFIPGALSGVERCTVDISLIALTLAFGLYLLTGEQWKLYVVIALAPLARETGFALPLGCMVVEAWHRRWRRAAWFATALLPGIAWTLFVRSNVSIPNVQHLTLIPMDGLWASLLHPIMLEGYRASAWIATVLYYLAVAGAFWAIYLVVRHFRSNAKTPAGWAMFAFTLVAVFAHADGLWLLVYHFGRALAPLLVLLFLEGLRRKERFYALPMLAVIPGATFATFANAGQLLGQLIRK
jgi:hypothetical protein